MLSIFICLCALTFMAYFYYGTRALYIVLISLFVGILSDIALTAACKRKYDFKDLSVPVSALTLALMMPASVRYSVVAAASFFMVIVGKHAFGSNKNLIFNPAAVSFGFFAICFGEEMRLFPIPSFFGKLPVSSVITDGLTNSFTYLVDSSTEPAVSDIDLLLGRFAGPMGTTHLIVIAVCAVSLLSLRAVSPIVFFSSIAVPVLGAVVSPYSSSVMTSVGFELLSGSTVFCLLFMGCYPHNIPFTKGGRLLYGVFAGMFTVLYRRYSGSEYAAVYGVLLANVFTLLFDGLALHAAYGLKRAAEAAAVGLRKTKIYVPQDKSNQKASEELKTYER